MAKFDEAILGILFRPPGPPIRSVENVHDDKMDRLTISDIQSRDGTIVTLVEDKRLDWDRLRDANDSYNSILVDPERALIPDFDRFD